MSGETETMVSGWTVDTLHGQLLMILDERGRRYAAQFAAMQAIAVEADKRYEQRFLAQQEAVQAALAAQEKAVNAALLAADRAVAKAEAASEKRFESVNEFRAQLSDQAANLMPRGEAEARFQATSEKQGEAATLSRDQLDRLRLELGALREESIRGTASLRDEFQKGIATLTAVMAGTAGRDHGIGQLWTALLASVGVALAAGAFILSLVR